MEALDIVIIGAGWHGLAMAKTYLEACPDVHMAVIDSAASIGGVWAKERLYPGLKTNNLVGSYEFGDFPMDVERFGVKAGQHIPGSVVHDYLNQFAEHFGLMSSMRLQQKVKSAELLGDGGWLLHIEPIGSEKQKDGIQIFARKLVLATGLTSEPFMPKFKGSDLFGRPLFHAKELQHQAQSLEAADEVAVLGGNKSSWDTCYFAAKAGARVHMIIRPSGGGPSWVWPVFFSPFRLSVQRMATTRFFTWFDPCIWSEKVGLVGWMRYFLHRTMVGRSIVSAFWYVVERFAQKAYRYHESPRTQNLKPWVSPFWMGNSLSVHNYASPWFDLVREGRITVHIADVASLSAGTVRLSNGLSLPVDAFVCCTGWITTPPIRFIPERLTAKLGLVEYSDDELDLVSRTHLDIFTEIPAIQDKPKRTLPPSAVQSQPAYSRERKSVSHRFCLYRFLVPPNRDILDRRNIAFIGAHLALSAITVAQLQALWITAYFMEQIPHLQPVNIDYDKIKYETVLHNEYTKIRHPHEAGGAGERCPDLTFDCLPYVDLLATDLGLKKYRKPGLWAEIWHRYSPTDYKNMVQEWLNLRR